MNGQSKGKQVEELIARLSINRNACDENELCCEVRLISENEKLQVIRDLIVFNVRLAAAVAARVHLAERQQVQLMRELLESGGSNTIRQFVDRLFSHRLSASLVLKELMRARANNPDAVSLMAYYFSGKLVFRSADQKSIICKLRSGDAG
ncbi:hypothetical protein [Pseudomonas xantholysinigenes]|uniref:Uncharacterized protein n=1 Tax=Pseudomonas xantholysinigenes TaxID=2745490 RepID=A0A9E6PTR9_9PSED|nr:hypothetical protein [Pseudomonas xantholysinigenes]QXI37019.1 hypothetical protein HU772_016895 [Pseudomonas xantholysinigenes]